MPRSDCIFCGRFSNKSAAKIGGVDEREFYP